MSNEISPPVFNRTLGQIADRHPDKNRTDTDTPYRGLSECLTGPSRLPLEERHKSINTAEGVSPGQFSPKYARTREGRRTARLQQGEPGLANTPIALPNTR